MSSGYVDILYEVNEGIGWLSINRPHKRNAFRPETVHELSDALERAIQDELVGVIVLSGVGKEAFCSGGDQSVRGEEGYRHQDGSEALHILEFQKKLRSCPKVTIAMVSGYAIGGGHVLHLLCDLTIASSDAIFGQVGPKVGSFDAGFGTAYLARIVGQKKAKEIWFLCRQYTAQEALEMGLVNFVVPYEELRATVISYCQILLSHSPMALRCLKAAFNADCDGQAGLQELAGYTTLLFYGTAEAQEGRNAFLEKRKPNFKEAKAKKETR